VGGLGLYFVSRPFDFAQGKISYVVLRPFDFAQGKIAYRGGRVLGRDGEFGGWEIGLVLGSFWVRFFEGPGVVYCHNPLSNRSLSSFLAFRKLGSFWVRFFERPGVVYCYNPLSNRSLSSFFAFRELGSFWVRLGSFFIVRGGIKFS